jgi:hypothetical protein
VAIAGKVQVGRIRQSVRRVEFIGRQGAYGPDWTSLVGTASTGVHCSLEGSVKVSAPDARLLVLLEGPRSPGVAVVRLMVNGRDAAIRALPSDAGWAASGLPMHEHWTFLEARLGPGDNRMALGLLAGADCARISAWVWAHRPGAPACHYPNALPAPELLSLDGAYLLAPADIATLRSDPLRMDRPVETIAGVFLDTLDPLSIKQGWGTLQRNKSVWEKPMTIAGKSYTRGLGTSSQTRIVYALDGRYRRFQSWVGADGATNPTITFEVWLDGRKAWETGLMTRETPARRVDINVSGAKRLELVVGDGGNSIVADHADWADARLLR